MKPNPNAENNLAKQYQFTSSELKRIDQIEQKAIANFYGDLQTLESALGMLKIGYQYGWKPLLLTHSKHTIKKYEEILGIQIREEFPEEGPVAHRSMALSLSKKLNNFWKIVSGDYKYPDKKKVDKK